MIAAPTPPSALRYLTPRVEDRPTLFALAIEACVDNDALPVLGDRVQEEGWFDARVCQIMFPLAPAPNGRLTTIEQVSRRRYRALFKEGYPEEFKRFAARPTQSWAKAILAVHLFGVWRKRPWPMIYKIRCDERGDPWPTPRSFAPPSAFRDLDDQADTAIQSGGFGPLPSKLHLERDQAHLYVDGMRVPVARMAIERKGDRFDIGGEMIGRREERARLEVIAETDGQEQALAALYKAGGTAHFLLHVGGGVIESKGFIDQCVHRKDRPRGCWVEWRIVLDAEPFR